LTETAKHGQSEVEPGNGIEEISVAMARHRQGKRGGSMKNTLSDLNNILFEQLERLSDDDLTGDDLDRQLKKTDQIIKVSEQIINNGELAFKAIQHKDKYYGTGGKTLPPMLEGEW
jgi:hypothetical protein